MVGDFQTGAKTMTWNTCKRGFTVRWSYVVESSSLSAGRSSPVVLGPQEFLAFLTRSFTQDFVYASASTMAASKLPLPHRPWNSQGKA